MLPSTCWISSPVQYRQSRMGKDQQFCIYVLNGYQAIYMRKYVKCGGKVYKNYMYQA